jgi:hypothetical protein
VTDHGLGGLPETEDPRDFLIEEYRAAIGVPMAALSTLPASYLVSPAPPQYNQGTTPRCVTYTAAEEKVHQDLIDQGLFTPAFGTFAAQIGTTAEGASMRVALDQLLGYGMPELGGVNASHHRIASYYSIPVTVADLKAAIHDFGGVLVIGTWANAWMAPGSTGVLKPFDSLKGWHATWIYGWNDSLGGGSFTGRNSWGGSWGDHGNYHLPYSRLGQYVKFAWKTSDVLEWVKRPVKCSGGFYRVGPGTSFRSVGSMHAGEVAMCRSGQAKAGGQWSLTCGTAKTGTGWWPIRAINGVSVQTKFGVALVYAATGWF